jgi:hypothetical protein
MEISNPLHSFSTYYHKHLNKCYSTYSTEKKTKIRRGTILRVSEGVRVSLILNFKKVQNE